MIQKIEITEEIVEIFFTKQASLVQIPTVYLEKLIKDAIEKGEGISVNINELKLQMK